MKRGSRVYWLIGLLLIFLIIDAGVATWLLTPQPVRRHVVQPGETPADIASRYGLHEQVIAEKNGLRPGSLLEPGQVLLVPGAPLAPLRQWEQQIVGLSATVVGAILCAWLASLSGLLPSTFGLGVTGIAAFLAGLHYVTVQLTSGDASLAITPLFLLNAVIFGFAWSAILLLLATALGFGQKPD